MTFLPFKRVRRVICAVAAVVASSTSQAEMITVSGSEQIVWRQQKQRCDNLQIPDAPFRAIRRFDGSIVAFSSDNLSRPLTGPSFDSLKGMCEPAFVGRESQNPEDLDYRAWIASLWTSDGRTVHALVHNEYRANQFPGRCKFTQVLECWYSIITYVQSKDGGLHFKRIGDPKVVAAPSFQQQDHQGRHRGFFNPSNIVELQGDYFSLIYTTGGDGQKAGACLFRLKKDDQPWNWLAFDGMDFRVPMTDPYSGQPNKVPCHVVGNFPTHVASVVKYRDKFIATIARSDGVHVSVSSNLIDWTKPTLSVNQPNDCNVRREYPTLLDPRSPSRFFDSMTEGGWLYTVRFNLTKCGITRDRDLTRLPVSLTQ